VTKTAVERVEQSGIIFLDEIDKIVGSDSQHGRMFRGRGPKRFVAYCGRIQCQHTLRYGQNGSYFIYRGRCFFRHETIGFDSRASGSFPYRVELDSLGKEEFIKILTEPNNALVKQYTEMMATEGLKLSFTEDAIAAIAEMATLVNEGTENIGARRLYTIMERLLDDISLTLRIWKKRKSSSTRNMSKKNLTGL
jgi:ATP-dependent HslUV protease ATP-binding subunit HslU